MTVPHVDLYRLLPVAVAIALPVLVVPLSWLAGYTLTMTTGYRYRPAHDPLYYAVFVVLAAAIVVASPVEIVISPGVLALAALPLGAVMYRLDVRVWEVWSGKSAESTVTPAGETATFLVGPVAEEVVYRGGLAVLLPWVGPVGYVAASAVLFGVNHRTMGTREIAIKTWNGAVYALGYLATGTLLVPVAAHLGYNLAFLLVARRRASNSETDEAPTATETDEASS